MKRPSFIGLASVIGVFVGGWITYYWDTHPNEELASKPEWSIVQGIEWQNRDKPSNIIEFEKMDGYSLVGIPVNSAKKVWIMLDAKNPPYYKQLPAGNYKLSKRDFKAILVSNTVSSTVANCLESHIEEP